MKTREESKVKGGDIIDLLIELKNEDQSSEEFSELKLCYTIHYILYLCD